MIFTTVDCAFSNGLNERLNQTLVNRIRRKINENKENKRAWVTIAQKFVEEYKNTIHSSTKFAPNYLLYGYGESLKLWELCSKGDLKKDRKIAYENSLWSHKRNAKRYNKNRADHKFIVGDQVL